MSQTKLIELKKIYNSEGIYINKNIFFKDNTAVKKIFDKNFYNYYMHKEIQQYIRQIIKSTQISKKGDLKNNLLQILPTEISDIINIKTEYFEQDSIINEAFCAFAVLNNLKKFVPIFRYIYGIFESDTNKIELVQEKTTKLRTLQYVISKLDATEYGICMLKSTLTILFAGLYIANICGVSNFQYSIKMKKVSDDSVILFKINGILKYFSTYGYIPIIDTYSYTSVNTEEYNFGTKRSFELEKNFFFDCIIKTVKQFNPKLFSLINENFFNNETKSTTIEPKDKEILSLINDKHITKFIDYFNLKYLRLKNTVISLLYDIDNYRKNYDNAKNNNEKFTYSSVIKTHTDILMNIYNSVSPELKLTLFELPRKKIGMYEKRYCTNDVLKSDLLYIMESQEIIFYDCDDDLQNVIIITKKEGLEHIKHINKMPAPDFNTLQNITETIYNFKYILRTVLFFIVLDGLILKYGKSDVTVIDELKYIKNIRDIYEVYFVDNENAINKMNIEKLNYECFVILVNYNIFVSEINNTLMDMVNEYKSNNANVDIITLCNKELQLYITSEVY